MKYVKTARICAVKMQLVLTKRPNGSWYVYSNDLRGSVTAIADEANSYAETCFYDIYGEPGIWKSLDGGIYNEIYYTGAIYDATTGLYYLSSRYYDSGIGRFTSMDSVRGDAKNPLSLNLYGYCEGNPVKYTDEEGENPILIGAIVGSGVAVIAEVLHQYIEYGPVVNKKQVFIKAVGGAISGAATGAGFGTGSQFILDAVGGTMENVVYDLVGGKRNQTEHDIKRYALNGLADAGIAAIVPIGITKFTKVSPSASELAKSVYDTTRRTRKLRNTKNVVKTYKKLKTSGAKFVKNTQMIKNLKHAMKGLKKQSLKKGLTLGARAIAEFSSTKVIVYRKQKDVKKSKNIKWKSKI